MPSQAASPELEERLIGLDADADADTLGSQPDSPYTLSRQPSIIYDADERETFGKRIEFLLTTVGYAVGLGNVWRFPYLCYMNGGGTFLVPYLIALVALGAPVFLLELAIGQLFRRGTYHSLCHIDSRLRWIGYLSIFVSASVALYYNVVIAWSLYYFFWCFRAELPWSAKDPKDLISNAEHFWEVNALDQSTGYYDVNRFNWGMVLCLVLAWVIIFLCIRKGIQSSGKVVYVTATLPYVLLVVLFFRGITLEGAGEGIRFYLTPDMSKLGDPDVWIAAANQIFFSLGTGFGSLITYGSYNPRDENVVQDAIMVPAINAFTSFFAGFGVFSILGHLAHASGTSVESVTKDGLGLAFIAYPAGLSLLPAPQFFCMCFFAMMFCLGVDSEFATVEVILTLVKDMKMKIPQEHLAAVLCFAGLCCGMIYATDAGIYWFSWTNDWSATFLLLIVVIFECIAVLFFYGQDRFSREFLTLCKRHIQPGWFFLLKYVTIPFCTALLAVNFIRTIADGSKKTGDVSEPPFVTFLGWMIGLGPVVSAAYCWTHPLEATEASSVAHVAATVNVNQTELESLASVRTGE
eukprot:TRINITY_DN8154_c2_g1_i1.p1 TRINITY_DN8154_c2_g1~~TRINITY_DN8154_c2_g1_i1.p1  ORF type:complete len:578 (+),score=188.13 TRINITY_DN8154_c2_g1_i1:246-1979(+)